MRLKKRLGQHLLRDRDILEMIAEAAGVRAGDRVLEVGPGPGTLTEVLAARVSRDGAVVAVELDEGWRPQLDDVRARFPQVEVRFEDALGVDVGELTSGAAWKCVANIPYYITSPLVQKIVEAGPRFEIAALLMQKEVAQRLHAASGRDVGMLSYYVQYHHETEVAFDVPAAAFQPPPRVDSALLVLRPRAHPPVDVAFDDMRPIIQAGFAARRKMLRRTLGSIEKDVDAWLARAGVDPQSRPEQLALEDYARLARTRG